MADTVIADKPLHLAFAEDVAHQTVVLVEKKATIRVAGCNAGGVLSAVLQNGQRVIKRLVYIGFSDYSNNATHAASPMK